MQPLGYVVPTQKLREILTADIRMLETQIRLRLQMVKRLNFITHSKDPDLTILRKPLVVELVDIHAQELMEMVKMDERQLFALRERLTGLDQSILMPGPPPPAPPISVS